MALMVTACGSALRFFVKGGGGDESIFTRLVAPAPGLLAMGGLLVATVANLRVLVGAGPGSGVVWLLPGLVVGFGAIGGAWGAVVARRYPNEVLGRGEPDPLADFDVGDGADL
jgi:hypothetical protein